MRRYRDDVLPTVPANENKIRLVHKTRSIAESIAAVAGTNWSPMTAEQQLKRIGWLAGWVEWLGREGWAEPSLIEGIAGGGKAGRNAATRRKSRTDRDKRDPFTHDELKLIFSASWFRDGKGTLTAAGTFRTWMPATTWLPLIGLLTGARLGEIAQLDLDDIWQNEHGVWLFNVIDGSDDEEGVLSKKRLKSASSRRHIPVHRDLVRLGLIHERGESTTEKTYLKDLKATDANGKLVRLINSVTYDFIAQIAGFDADAGLQAVADALARKDGGRGAEKD